MGQIPKNEVSHIMLKPINQGFLIYNKEFSKQYIAPFVVYAYKMGCQLLDKKLHDKKSVYKMLHL